MEGKFAGVHDHEESGLEALKGLCLYMSRRDTPLVFYVHPCSPIIHRQDFSKPSIPLSYTSFLVSAKL
jgi:hypothetical protein